MLIQAPGTLLSILSNYDGNVYLTGINVIRLFPAGKKSTWEMGHGGPTVFIQGNYCKIMMQMLAFGRFPTFHD